MLGEALGLVGGGEGDEEEEGEAGLRNNLEWNGNEEEEKQLQNMMYNLMVWINNAFLDPKWSIIFQENSVSSLHNIIHKTFTL